jgi:hypothetical protein
LYPLDFELLLLQHTVIIINIATIKVILVYMKGGGGICAENYSSESIRDLENAEHTQEKKMRFVPKYTIFRWGRFGKRTTPGPFGKYKEGKEVSSTHTHTSSDVYILYTHTFIETQSVLIMNQQPRRLTGNATVDGFESLW